MQYSIFLLSAIAATGAMAAPATSMPNSRPKPVGAMDLRLRLDGSPDVLLTKKNFDSDVEFKHTFKNQGPFGKVTLELGAEVKNQDVRCQLADDQETPKPIILTRGQNIDINFSKGDPWTFKDMKESKVTTVICGPNQLKTDQQTVKEIVVSLKKKADPGTVVTQEISQTKFEEDQLPQEKAPEGTLENKEYDQVQLAVGFAIENRDLRCQILDTNNERIIVTRGENIDFTFGDGDNPNVWEFANGPSEVSKIVCDPAFKKDDASAEVNQPADNGAVATPEEEEEEEAGQADAAVVTN